MQKYVKWCWDSKRAILACFALVLMILIPPGPRNDVLLARTGETERWVLAVIAATFGISSTAMREKLWPLAILAAVLSVLQLIGVVIWVLKWS